MSQNAFKNLLNPQEIQKKNFFEKIVVLSKLLSLVVLLNVSIGSTADIELLLATLSLQKFELT